MAEKVGTKAVDFGDKSAKVASKLVDTGSQAKSKFKTDAKVIKTPKGPCPWLCSLVPTNVPRPEPAQTVLHPRKDVFVLKFYIGYILSRYSYGNEYQAAKTMRSRYLKVAKVGATGDRRCKMELELVTPKGVEKKAPSRIDTRETQCEPEPCCCCCGKASKKKKK